MLSHIFKTATTHLWKNKAYSLLNILGITLGIASVFLIALFLKSELSYDQHFDNADNIYRIGSTYNFDGKIDQFANAARPVSRALQNEIPQVEAQTRIVGINGLFTHRAILKVDEHMVKTEQAFYADSTYFQVFEHDFLAGNPTTVLNRPNAIVITESLSKRLFSSVDALGKRLKVDNQLEVEVTGVLKDDNRPTHLPIEALVSYEHGARPGEMNRWIGGHVYTYVRLQEGSKMEALTSQLPKVYEKFMQATFTQFGGSAELLAQPLTSIHLESKLQWEAYANGDQTNVYVFMTVALLIILLVVINYTNLTTAQALQRFKEISIRKVLGSSRKMIFLQLVADSLLISFLSCLFAIVLVWLLLPYFGQITQLDLGIEVFTSPSNLLVLTGLALFIALISSLYPAIYVSRFNPIEHMGGRYAGGKKSALGRKALVGTQFFIAVVLLFATSTVIKQSQYMLNKDLGFDRDNTMALQVRDPQLQQRIETIRNEMIQVSGVFQVAATRSYPGQPLVQGLLDVKEPDGSYTGVGWEFMESGFDFPEALGLEIIEGRSFDRSFGSDLDNALLVNAAAAQLLGGTEAAVGREISMGTDSLGNRIDSKIVGVVKDFHTVSLRSDIQPIVLTLSGQNNALLIRTNLEDHALFLNWLETYWLSLNSEFPLEYTFLDDDFVSLHNKEADLQRLLTYFSVLIVLIACLGLLGLVSYATRRKAREITIRKVVGSSQGSLVKLMLMGQLTPILVSLVIAIPAGWFLMNSWLSNFAFRISIQWTQVLAVVFIILSIALLTMVYHVIRATKTNPAKVLRVE